MGKLIVIQDGKERSFELIDDITFVGSGGASAIRVKGEGVAEQHCQILKVDGSYRVIDLGTPAGVKVNGEKVTQRALENGDVIQVGTAVLNFRGGVRPEAISAPEPDATSAPRPTPPRGQTSRGGSSARGGGAGRRSAGRASARGRGAAREGREIEVSDSVRKAASQRETLTRKRVRKAGLSGPATMAIGAGVALIAIFIGYKLLTGIQSSEVGDYYEQGMNYYRDQEYELAKAAFEKVPEGAAAYRFAQKKLEEMAQVQDKGTDLKKHRDGVRWYENQILEYINNKVETENPKYKGDTAHIRYVVKRMDHFLANFQGHKYYPQVEALHGRYQPMVPTTPPTWHDIAVEANAERAIKQFGPSYRLVTQWIASNGGAGEDVLGQAERLRDKILRGAEDYWQQTDKLARENIENNRPSDAYSKYMQAARRFEGLAKYHDQAKSLADELERRLGDILNSPGQG